MKRFLLIGALIVVPLFALGRDPGQVRKFRAENPCPATGKTRGACPGWVVDHRIPLCAGGKDAPSNMQWQDKRASYQKDYLERWICRLLKKQHQGD